MNTVQNNEVPSRERAIHYYSATWCQPCKILRPIMESVSEQRDDIEVFYIDVDENQQLAMDSSVTGVPTLRFYVGGDEVGSSVGAKPRREIDNMISEYFGDA